MKLNKNVIQYFKKYLQVFIVLTSMLLFIFSCINKNIGQRNKNVWIGAYINEDVKYPNAVIYNSDSVFTFTNNIDKKLIKDKSNFKIISDSISVYSKKVDSDTINFFYKRARETNFEFNRNNLYINNWESKEIEEDESFIKVKNYFFKKDSTLAIQTNYLYNGTILYSEVENFRYRFIDIDKTYVLQIYSASGFSYFGQIVQKNKESFIVEFLNYIRPKRIKFSQTEQKHPTSQNKFNLCFETSVFQYFNFNAGTKFKDGLKGIKTIVENKYRYTSNEKNQNGYIRIRFIVNCEGKMGRFSSMELNENYQSFSFDPNIISSLFKVITTDLKNGWIPGVIDTYLSQKTDNYKHLTFKIKEGKIIDILP